MRPVVVAARVLGETAPDMASENASLVELSRREHGVALLRLNDPQRLNAMSEAMGAAFSGALETLAQDPELRALVLTGAGRAFSAGGDLDMLERMGRTGRADPGGPARRANSAAMGRFYRMFLSLRGLPVPVIAALTGHAIGAGFCVALACDLRIAAREARLGLNFVKLGLHPGMAATWTLPRLVGPAVSADLLYSGRLVDGAEAERIGLVNRALPREDVLEDALATAAEIASAAPLAVRALRRSLAVSPHNDIERQLDLEAEAQAQNYESEDLEEGLRALREKREPLFKGH